MQAADDPTPTPELLGTAADAPYQSDCPEERVPRASARGYRTRVLDADVRQQLLCRLRAEHVDNPSRFVDEFDVAGDGRVDLAVINGALSGYEIKGPRDSLRRLPGQVQAYGLVFDFLTIVVADKHLAHALDVIPAWWAVISVHGDADDVHLRDERPGQLNTAVDPSTLAWLLWRDELLDELTSRGLAKGFRSKPRRVLCERLAVEVPLDELRGAVRDRLKARSNWRAAQ